MSLVRPLPSLSSSIPKLTTHHNIVFCPPNSPKRHHDDQSHRATTMKILNTTSTLKTMTRTLPHTTTSSTTSRLLLSLSTCLLTFTMAPNPSSAAGKVPTSTASKVAAEDVAGKATKKMKDDVAPADGEKKRRKARKETYSSYIYKGKFIGIQFWFMF